MPVWKANYNGELNTELMKDIESAKKYVESVCALVAEDHNVEINMAWTSMINNPEWSQPEIDYTLIVKSTNHKSHTKQIHFHEKQLLHCKSEHETLRISHHMLNLCKEHAN